MDVLDADRGFKKEVDTVRALHQTVVSLRAALERSRVEIEELKERVWSSESCELALQNLSVENHILRQKIISVDFKETTTQTSIPCITVDTFERKTNYVTEVQSDAKDELLNTSDNSLVTIETDSPIKTSGLKFSPRSISPIYLFQSELSPIKSPTRTSALPQASLRSKTPVSNKSELSQESGLSKVSLRDGTLSNLSDLTPVKSGKDEISKYSPKKFCPTKYELSTTSETKKLTTVSESSVKSEEGDSKYSPSKSEFITSSDKKEYSPTLTESPVKSGESEYSPRKDSSTPSKSELSTVKTVSDSKDIKLSLRKTAKTNSEVKKSKDFSTSASERSPRSRDTKLDTNKTSPRKSSLKSKESEAKKHIKLTTFKKSTRKVTGHEVKLHPVEVTEPGKCPKKSKVKGHKLIVAPRQTVVTVNVTLKSPRKDKDQENTSTNKPTLLSVTTELPPFQSSKNETSAENSAQEITEDTSSERTMDEEQNNIHDEENDNEQKESDNDEVDDIELIFTTDETTTVIKEELVSIADGNDDCDTPVLMNYRTVDFDTTDLHLSCDTMDKELDDDVFQEIENDDNFENENTENFNFQNSSQIHNSKSDNSINRDSFNTENESRDKSLKSCYSYQDSSFESRSLDKDESFDKFDDKEKYLHKMWSNNSVLVETDISKCGIVDPELPLSSTRRNTCPNPVPYRPIMHREALAKHNTRTLAVKFNARNDNTPRPVLNENNYPKTESEAQTDISALPSLWKSESYLAHKVAHQFTTLPSKFPMPISQKHLRLSEKTKEARRVLLSDINFTSMVPELSRSADHLYQEGLEVMQTCGYGQYLNPPGPQLRRYNTGDSLTSPSFLHSQKFNWSPSDYSNFSSTKFDNSNQYLNRYRGSLTSINQNSFDVPDNMKRRSYPSSHWRQNVPASFDNSRFMQSGQGPYRSVPSSPTRSRSVPFISSYGGHMQQYPGGFKHSQVRFGRQGNGGLRYINGSLPELHGDQDSGDSTDSLVEEAEQYLRSSIDCIVSGRDISHVSHMKRRSSAPCSGRDSSPPRNWTPFLPHGIKDLRSDNWVKVIGPEGKIRGGRVRYVGYVLGQQEPYVGLELATSSGNCDGCFNNRRYFECSPNYALFIPFKKVVMGWRN